MRRVDDLHINTRVRSTIVHFGMDTTKCHYETYRGKVYVRGNFLPIARQKDMSDSERKDERMKKVSSEVMVVLRIEETLKRIPGVKDVIMNLDGFVKEKGTWRPKM